MLDIDLIANVLLWWVTRRDIDVWRKRARHRRENVHGKHRKP